MKIRSFEIKRDGGDKYTIKVDGQAALVNWNKAVFVDLEKNYHGVNVDQEIIAVVMQELTLQFDLSESEIQEYTQTLKHILED